jgi:tRNA pseudouridine55 synthase
MMTARNEVPATPRTRRGAWRDVHGIVLLDKPVGLSSNQALQAVRRLLRARKGGHAGTLDPMASGLLPLCFGEATKLAGGLLGSRKAYVAECRLGVTTDTDDAAGEIVSRRPVPALETAALEALLDRFRGRIMQAPPVYSALHHAGERLYAKARRGEKVAIPAREVEIHRLVVLGRTLDILTLEVECGTGTYIRSLARDLGEALGCGAHVKSLRRLWVAPFAQPVMHTLGELAGLREQQGEPALDALLLPIEAGLVHWPRVELDASQAVALGHGQPVQLGEAGPVESVNVVDAAGRSLGLAGIDAAGVLRARRLLRWAAQA